MKIKFALTIAVLFFSSIPLVAQKSRQFNLHQLFKDNGIDVYNREISVIQEKGYEGIRLSPSLGEGVAWIKGIEFSNGTIEFDVRGSDEKQRSFVGFAFHGKDNATFDAIYLRPFQFLEQNEELRKRGVQYISLPAHTWRKLRENSPGKYENAVNSSPDPNGWVHVKIVIKNKTVSTYINGAKEPCLVIEKITDLKTGSIGFYVADVSGGDFANLTITKSE